MHIDRIDLFHVGLPLKQPAQTGLRRQEALETVVVRMAGGGAVGWGEAGPGNAPVASGEWAAGVLAVLRDWLAPAVAGTVVDSAEDLQQRLAEFRGNLFAKAALDTAWWDLRARLEGKPLHELLGGHRTAVEVGPTFDRMPSGDEFLARIAQALAVGFARVKLMFRPGWDVEMLRAVRREFPGQTFHIDCEGGLGLQHMEMLCRLDDFCLAMIEQPLPADDLVGHAMVQETIRTPIGLDESVSTLAQAEMALDLKSGQWVSLTPGKLGGLTPAVAIHDACQAGEVSCWVGAMPQSALGTRFELALAAKANCRYPADFFPAEEVLACDLAEPLRPVRDPADGVVRVPLWTGPGIGVEPEPALLEQYTLQRAALFS
jgi:O-succinylbenzoate synthase